MTNLTYAAAAHMHMATPAAASHAASIGCASPETRAT